MLSQEKGEKEDSSLKMDKEEFYVLGSEEFYKMRKWLVRYSLNRAKDRINSERILKQRPIHQVRMEREELYRKFKETSVLATEIGSERPLSCCSFSIDGTKLAIGSFSGEFKIWNIPDLTLSSKVKAHKDRLCSISLHPNPVSSSSLNMATCSVDTSIKLWSLDSELPLGQLDGHALRVSKVAFHPSGKYLGSSSYDTSWRLWDLETQKELMLQEGHSKEVHTLAFQVDGSLASTAGLDAIARVWDLRTTHAVMTLQGHIGAIYSVDFSRDGFELATGGDDNIIKIWDLRTCKCIQTIPAHTSLISQLKYGDGVLMSSSFDGTAKMWGRYNHKLCSVLNGHEGKVQGVDVLLNGSLAATVGYDRTFKLWGYQEIS